MFSPKQFAENDPAVLHALINENPLATLVVMSADGLNANHIPLQLSPQDGAFGVLRGHVARANPLWRDFDPLIEVLAVFHGPQAHITPSWYPSKQVDGKAVPTWNYAVAHVYGRLTVTEDAEWLQAQVESLSARNEAAVGSDWQVSDAPHDYVRKLLKAIVGIEIAIMRLEGKWKVSQNQPHANQAGVVAGLQNLGNSCAADMAGLVAGKFNG